MSVPAQVRQALVIDRQEASSDRLGRMATCVGSLGRSAATFEYRECNAMQWVLLSLSCGTDWLVFVRLLVTVEPPPLKGTPRKPEPW